MFKSKYLVLALVMFSVITGCTTAANPNTLQTAVTSTPTASVTSQSTLDGTVQDVSLSARVIYLAEPVEGVEAVAVTDGTQIIDGEGVPLTLRQIQPGQFIQVVGEKQGNSLLARRVFVVEEALGESVGVSASESMGWSEYSSDTLQIGFQYPARWQVSEEGGVIYVYSDKTTEYGAKYYLYIEEYPVSQEQTLKQVIADRWGNDVAQGVQITEMILGEKTVYETSDIPSADGALTLFVKGDSRYIAVSLTPYNSETQPPEQKECEQVLRSLVSSMTLRK